GKARVARIGCEQMLERMPRRGLDVRPCVRVDHADVVGRDVPVDAGGIHAGLQLVVVDLKARDPLHALAASLLSGLRNLSSCWYSRQSSTKEIRKDTISAIGKQYHSASRPTNLTSAHAAGRM